VTLAVIGTFFERHENTFPLMHRLFVDGTRKPDETWLMCESHKDAYAINEALEELCDLEVLDDWPEGAQVVVLPTPQTNGTYDVIPYSNKINSALDASAADLFCYLDNGSMPGPDKYRVMAQALEEHPEWGAVYCTQERTGFANERFTADKVMPNAYCQLNYTQVMHRKTSRRWTLDMQHANPDLADAIFWRDLHSDFGAFYPAGGGTVHDFHHIPHPGLAGVA